MQSGRIASFYSLGYFPRITKASKNYRKQKLKVARVHEKVANQRKDFLHKRSRQIADGWDAVAVEDIHLRGLAGSLRLGKSTNDNEFGMFRTFLEYKLGEQGKRLVVIDKWFPSSKPCSRCSNYHRHSHSLASPLRNRRQFSMTQRNSPKGSRE